MKIHPQKRDEIIQYDKRFINVQKWIYNSNNLSILHPLCSTELNDLNDEFIKKNHQFTPKDSALLWEKFEEVFEDNDKEELIEDLSPDIFKDDSILTLDDTRDYENLMKNTLVFLKK